MFPRVIKRKNKDGQVRQYLALVKSVRVGDKVVQKTVAHLGKLEEFLEGNTIRNIIQKFAELHPQFKNSLVIADASELSRDCAKCYGPLIIFRAMWERLGLSDIFNDLLKTRKGSADLSEAVFAMVCHRLLDPGSKRQASQWADTVHEPKWNKLKLQHLYRGMDTLIAQKDAIEIKLFERTKDLFNLEVDMILFDTTSVMSWGDGEEASILKHGHSKEKRPDLKQIMVGVLMTKEGIPIGHEVWEGNQNDKKSFANVIARVQRRFSVKQVILVGDRGMISQKNIEAIEEAGLGYILGVPMRQLSATKREALLSESPVAYGEEASSAVPGFELVVATEEKRLYVRDKALTDEETGTVQRYIVCYNPNEAENQQKKREYFKDIIQKKVEINASVKDWVVKNGYKKYLEFGTESGEDVVIKVDMDRFEKEAIYDGKWVLTTNTTLSSEEIAKAYKGLSQIEQGFRALKSAIEIGPMYHWTTKRIRAHVFVCVLALTVEIACQKTFQKLGLSFSQSVEALKSIDVSKTTLGKKSFLLTSEPSDTAKQLFNALDCKLPKKVL